MSKIRCFEQTLHAILNKNAEWWLLSSYPSISVIPEDLGHCYSVQVLVLLQWTFPHPSSAIVLVPLTLACNMCSEHLGHSNANIRNPV